MNLDPQDFLRLVEDSGTLAFWDTESQGREGDYGRIYVVSVLGYDDRKPTTFHIEQRRDGSLGTDQKLVREARDYLNSFDAWVTFYGKGHDVPLLNTRLLRWGLDPLEQIPHVDLYFILKSKLLTGRKSQAHLLEFLTETMKAMGVPPREKLTVSPNVWSDLPSNFRAHMATLVKRCESDVLGLRALYSTTKHLVRDIRR